MTQDFLTQVVLTAVVLTQSDQTAAVLTTCCSDSSCSDTVFPDSSCSDTGCPYSNCSDTGFPDCNCSGGLVTVICSAAGHPRALVTTLQSSAVQWAIRGHYWQRCPRLQCSVLTEDTGGLVTLVCSAVCGTLLNCVSSRLA